MATERDAAGRLRRVLYPLFQRPDPMVRLERGRRSDGSDEEADGSGEVDDGSGEDETRSRVRD